MNWKLLDRLSYTVFISLFSLSLAHGEVELSVADDAPTINRAAASMTNDALVATAPERDPLKLTLKLRDGSRVIGIPSTQTLSVKTPYADIDVSLTLILQIEFSGDHESVSIWFQNGDRLEGTMELSDIEIQTLFGKHSVAVRHIATLDVVLDGATLGRDKVVDLGGGVDMALVWIEPGTFMMGSPSGEDGRWSRETQHRVTLSKGFWMGKYEVTQAQWQQVMGSNPSNFKGVKNPVEQVSWDACQDFLRKLNGKKGDGSFRLPTEAEWEYACRAGTTTALNSGKALTSTSGSCRNLDAVAWYGKNSSSTTHPVGQKAPNAWGLYDMLGNVYEWCQDWHGGSSGSATDPTGASSGSYRVLRGGSWRYSAGFCRSAHRNAFEPTVRYNFVGFRVVWFR